MEAGRALAPGRRAGELREMTTAFRELWALQQIDSRIQELQRELSALDTGAQAGRVRDAARAKLDSSTAELRRIESELADTELAIKSTEARIREIEGRMYSGKVTNPKELESLSQEVDMLKRNQDRLETRELELLDEQEKAKETVARARILFQRKQKEYDDTVAATGARRAGLEDELKRAQASREEQEKRLKAASGDLFRRYETLRPKLGGVAVAPVQGGCCGACKVRISSQLLAAIEKGEAVVSCDSCARILVPGE
jgi:predicted  nucleic acid-binding Zn-ribbon protein